MTDPLALLLHSIPASFFQNLAEQMDAAFGKALRIAQNFEEPEWANLLGQARHACCEEGFRMAARDAGLTAHALHTNPVGGRYSLVHEGQVHLLRCNVKEHLGTPRLTQFRSDWAAQNHWLNPIQADLFRSVQAPSPDGLCGMITVTAHRRGGDPSVPAFVGLGVPRHDLSDWLLLKSVQDLLGFYHDNESRTRALPEAPVKVKDQAMPRLKQRPNEKQKG